MAKPKMHHQLEDILVAECGLSYHRVEQLLEDYRKEVIQEVINAILDSEYEPTSVGEVLDTIEGVQDSDGRVRL